MRSTVNSSTIPAKTQEKVSAFDNRKSMEQMSTGTRNPNACGNLSKVARPPQPRVPTARPGRVVGPVVPYENVKHDKETPILPQSISPHYFFGSNSGKKQGWCWTEAEKESSLTQQYMASSMSIHMNKAQPQPYMPNKLNPGIVVEVDSNPYYQPQAAAKVGLNGKLTIDVKLLQAQSQFGIVGAAAVAVAAHREVSDVQLRLTS